MTATTAVIVMSRQLISAAVKTCVVFTSPPPAAAYVCVVHLQVIVPEIPAETFRHDGISVVNAA